MKIGIAIMVLCIVSGCARQGEEGNTVAVHVPQNAEVETCSACGMVIREQPAPRGQVIHRDGTRVFLCSISDLVQYVQIPSPHGKPAVVYSEALRDGHLPENMDKNWQAWMPVEALYFVSGIHRIGVMGEPVMAYSTEKAARECALEFDGEVLKFIDLKKGGE